MGRVQDVDFGQRADFCHRGGPKAGLLLYYRMLRMNCGGGLRRYGCCTIRNLRKGSGRCIFLRLWLKKIPVLLARSAGGGIGGH